MTVQFVLGDGVCDHTETLVQKADEWLQQDANHRVFFLVPNYNKFEREIEILQALKQKNEQTHFSSMKTQIFSFQRLSWYYTQQSGYYQADTITEIGAKLLMRKVLTNLKEQLHLFRGEIDKVGFLTQLLELYQEFQLSGLTTEQLHGIDTTQITLKRELQTKLSELTLIFTAYEQELVHHQVTLYDPLQWLIQYLKTPEATLAAQLKQTLFIVTGFSSFQAKEFQLLTQLMIHSTLTVDLILTNRQQHTQGLDLFYDAARTYTQIATWMKQHQLTILPDHVIDTPLATTPRSKGRLALSEFWESTQQMQGVTIDSVMSEYATIWQVETPEEEVRQIGLEIKRLVSREHKHQLPLTYKDIQLSTLDTALYVPYIEPIFSELDIPFYIDQEKLIRQHPIVQFLATWFDLDRYYYRETDIFNLLKSELFIPTDYDKPIASFRELVDQTENISLAHHLSGMLWISKTDWEIYAYDPILGQPIRDEALTLKTNQLRRAFYTQLYQPLSKLKKARTMKEAITLFYQFLLEQQIDQQLIQWRNQAVLRGQLDEARNHEQTWQHLMDILDEFVNIYDEEAFDWEGFTVLLMSSLENLSFGKIPTSLDQVQINRLDLARPNQSKVTFALGLTETAFPRKVENHTLLDVTEREWLNEQLGELGYIYDRAKETRQKEPYVAYSLFLSSTQLLYLTYPATSETDHTLQPSPYLARFLSSMPQLLVKKGLLTLTADPLNYVGSYRGAIRQINQLTRQAKQDERSLPTAWSQLQRKVRQSKWNTLAQRVFLSQDDQNVPVALTQEQAQRLYGREMYSSVSRLETFHECEYRYFMQYGLKLKERDIYGITPAVTGEFFHDALDRFLSILIKENISLSSLTPETRQEFMQQVLKEIFGETRYQLLSRSARMDFLFQQLGKTINRVSWALHEQSQKTKLSPVQTEVLFGQVAAKKGIKGLELDLASGGKLHVRGKIDRIDQVDVDQKTYLSVVDYKSSKKEFDPTEVYYGLAMQLVTYLDVVLQDAAQLVGKREVQPAGAYYVKMQDPLISGSTAKEKRESERLKAYKYSGLFIQDQALFAAYDTSLAKSQHSEVFPIRKDKHDDYTMIAQSKDRFYTPNEVETLRAYNREKMRHSADRLQSGEIALNPSLRVEKQARACEHCPFRSVCKFDAVLPENHYQKIETIPKQEILKKMEGIIHE